MSRQRCNVVVCVVHISWVSSLFYCSIDISIIPINSYAKSKNALKAVGYYIQINLNIKGEMCIFLCYFFPIALI